MTAALQQQDKHPLFASFPAAHDLGSLPINGHIPLVNTLAAIVSHAGDAALVKSKCPLSIDHFFIRELQ